MLELLPVGLSKPPPLYSVEFEHRGLPRLPFQLGRTKLFSKNLHNQRWRMIVARKLMNRLPEYPLTRAELHFERHSKVFMPRPDLENSFFVILNVLVDLGVLVDHSPSVIGTPTYRHIQTREKRGKIVVRIEERTA